MSSAAIYGNGAPIGKKRVITEDTLPSPAHFNGNSKLIAEEGLGNLESNLFKVPVSRLNIVLGRWFAALQLLDILSLTQEYSTLETRGSAIAIQA